eukprot:135993_1
MGECISSHGTRVNSVDVDMCRHHHQICDSTVQNCQCILRIIKSIEYYHTLNITNNQKHQNKLVKFCKETYKCLLDDYIHLITKHNNDLDQIFTIMTSEFNINFCNLFSCTSTINHHRNRTKYGKNSHQITGNKDFIFYRDIMDNIHYYLYHLYDVGLRIKLENNDHENTENKQLDFDIEFSQISQTSRQIRNKLKKISKCNFNRYENTNKYTLSVSDNKNDHKHTDITLMDGLYQHIKYKNINERIIWYLMNEEYDSNAVQIDVMRSTVENSNIAENCDNKNEYILIESYLRNIKLSKHSFNIGYRFYYWNYYHPQNRNRQDSQTYHNWNDHSGFERHELYITVKYTSLKAELLSNNIHSLTMFELNESMVKAMEYMNTEKAKQITASYIPSDRYHYDIPEGTCITFNHLLTVILYTDWSEFSTQLTSTFRKTQPYETLSMLKLRNKEFANCSKTLRECVECFGNFGWQDWLDDKQNIDAENERGPVFCGMNFVMVIPQFNIRLCGPTSTTKSIAVALRFATDNGM